MNAHLVAGLAVLDELYDDLLALIRETDDDALNWTPPVAEANSIAALTRHVAGSLDAWLTRAAGEPVERNRDAEFRYRGTSRELIDLIERSREASHDRFAQLATIDPFAVRFHRRLGDADESALSVAWCIEHALVHAAEHWGQIQLNRQLYAAQ
jgi:hypothetical protein